MAIPVSGQVSHDGIKKWPNRALHSESVSRARKRERY